MKLLFVAALVVMTVGGISGGIIPGFDQVNADHNTVKCCRNRTKWRKLQKN